MNNEINFQIQYFPETEKEKFKNWAWEKKISMKSLLLKIINNKEKIEKIISE